MNEVSLCPVRILKYITIVGRARQVASDRRTRLPVVFPERRNIRKNPQAGYIPKLPIIRKPLSETPSMFGAGREVT